MTENPYDHGDAPAEAASESTDNTQVNDAGIEGQIQYPDRVVDAERAAAFAAGHVESLEPQPEVDAEQTEPEADEESP